MATRSLEDVRAAITNKYPIFRHWAVPYPFGYPRSWTIYVDKDAPWITLRNPTLLEITNIHLFQFADKRQDPLREIEHPEVKRMRYALMNTDELSFLIGRQLPIGLIPTYFKGVASSASNKMGIQTWGMEAELSIEWKNSCDHEGWEDVKIWAAETREYLTDLLDQHGLTQGNS